MPDDEFDTLTRLLLRKYGQELAEKVKAKQKPPEAPPPEAEEKKEEDNA